MELKDKLVSLRKKSGLSQALLAEKLAVSRQTVSNWELGEILPSTDNLVRLSKLYGVSLDYLVSDDVEHPAVAVAVAERPGEQIMEAPGGRPFSPGSSSSLPSLWSSPFCTLSSPWDTARAWRTPPRPIPFTRRCWVKMILKIPAAWSAGNYLNY